MKPDLMLWIEGKWYRRHGGVWDVSGEPLSLAGPSRIITDFDGAASGVMAVDTKPEFAAPVIEKRLRSEGLVDGETRVLAHRVIEAGGGCRVFYTAVPLPKWQETFAWLHGEPSVGLIYSIEAVMLALTRRHGAVLCRAGRHFQLLVSQGSTLAYITATAFSDDIDDLDTALRNLTEQALTQWTARAPQTPVLWCDLLAADGADAARLPDEFAQRLDVAVTMAPVTRFDGEGGAPMRTAADFMSGTVSWTAAANPWSDRLAAGANEYLAPVAALAALVGIAFVAAAMYLSTQTEQLQLRVDAAQRESGAIARRVAGFDVPPAEILASHAETLTFLDDLARASHSPDPLRFVTDVRLAADRRVRVMRVRLLSPEGVYRVDGVPVVGSTADQALAGFIGALRAAGYQANAEDPGSQGAQPGYFSYSIRRLPARDGVMQ
jgi:hypothetical protein